MRVYCDVIETELENDNGYEIEATQAECRRCGHITESFGTSHASTRRCLALMREECPNNERNFYVES